MSDLLTRRIALLRLGTFAAATLALPAFATLAPAFAKDSGNDSSHGGGDNHGSDDHGSDDRGGDDDNESGDDNGGDDNGDDDSTDDNGTDDSSSSRTQRLKHKSKR